MDTKYFATPADAENAFYRAFENSDLDIMMSVWLDADYVECIHPMSHRLTGISEIRDAWVEIFHVTDNIKCETLEERCIEHNGLAIHTVVENIIMDKGKRTVSILATNIYEKTPFGWRMILHHASPAPKEFNDTDNPPPTMH
ncbi:MAG: nuclear transport factor 2 family protein [Gammaproteobacteria bacterium]|nr:nuclear transport factor 2 family protein [Gammaproteobacteria bacterium]